MRKMLLGVLAAPLVMAQCEPACEPQTPPPVVTTTTPTTMPPTTTRPAPALVEVFCNTDEALHPAIGVNNSTAASVTLSAPDGRGGTNEAVVAPGGFGGVRWPDAYLPFPSFERRFLPQVDWLLTQGGVVIDSGTELLDDVVGCNLLIV